MVGIHRVEDAIFTLAEINPLGRPLMDRDDDVPSVTCDHLLRTDGSDEHRCGSDGGAGGNNA